MSDFEKYLGNVENELSLSHIEELFAAGHIDQGLRQAKLLLEKFHPAPPRLTVVEEIRLAETEVRETSDHPPTMWQEAAADIALQVERLQALIAAYQ